LVKPDEIVTFLEHTQGYFLKKEFAEKKIFIPPQVQEIIDRLNAEILIPMILQDKMIGILSLGKKKSDEDYTQDDLDILLPLARTLAIAISNAELFDDLGKAQAEAAQKEKMALIGTLAAGMAHEIRNPITTIKIFAEYLKEKKDDPEFIAKFEKLVPKEVEKINSMITHLLEFSKPADYRSMQAVDLKEPLEEVLEILQAEMALNDILLKDSIRHVSSISGNKKYVQEIMFNLIQNAVHAIGRRGTITITAEDYPGNVELKVSDTGCGISAENLQHIFEPFFTTKMDSEGVGLGLYVIKQLMLRMGGNISVESKMGEGTTFSLKFIKAV
jgi:signal transduction histidine kinase